VTFTSNHYEQMLQPSEQTGRQGVWQLLQSFGLQQLTLDLAVQHLLQLYKTDRKGTPRCTISLADHTRHLNFLAQCVSNAVCLQQMRSGLLLYSTQRTPAGEGPTSRPQDIHWPIEVTAGAEAMTEQLPALCGLRLVHPWYGEQGNQAVQQLVKSITQALTLAEVSKHMPDLFYVEGITMASAAANIKCSDEHGVGHVTACVTGLTRLVRLLQPAYPCWHASCQLLDNMKCIKVLVFAALHMQVWKHLLDLHSQQPLQQCASKMGMSLGDLLLQQVTYLAGVRLQLQSHLQEQPRQSSKNNSAGSKQIFFLLNSTGKLAPSSQISLPPSDAVTASMLQELAATGQSLALLNPCFEPCWCEPDSEQCLLLTKLLGVKQVGPAAIIGALVNLHSKRSSILAESQLFSHLAYLTQHTQLLSQKQQKGLLQQVQAAFMLLDASGQYQKAGALHMPLGSQFAALQSDMASAGMLFLHSRT
jgi:hypothetical protein